MASACNVCCAFLNLQLSQCNAFQVRLDSLSLYIACFLWWKNFVNWFICQSDDETSNVLCLSSDSQSWT